MKASICDSENQMKLRILKLARTAPQIRRSDVLVTHAPARGIGDGEDMVHRGYKSFLRLMEKYHPSYMLHGHVHMPYDYTLTPENQYQGTTIIQCI